MGAMGPFLPLLSNALFFQGYEGKQRVRSMQKQVKGIFQSWEVENFAYVPGGHHLVHFLAIALHRIDLWHVSKFVPGLPVKSVKEARNRELVWF